MKTDEQLEREVKSMAESLQKVVAGIGFEDEDDRDGEFDFGNEHDRLRWYFEDVLDVRFTISAQFEFINAEILLAYGGPNIWYNTAEGRVHGYWDGRAEYFVDHDTRDAIDSYWEEEFDMLRDCRR